LNIRIEDGGSLDERSRIRAVIELAFGGSEEAELVDSLRGSGHALLSLVAEVDGVVTGHILLSRMWIDTSTELVAAVALAPVAVHPDRQREGIGSLLIQHGLELLRERGEAIVIVAGHPAYYPRFGFSKENARLLRSPFPADAFMAIELRAGALQGIRGSVVYPAAFGI
jgi:putative acetyltransferase